MGPLIVWGLAFLSFFLWLFSLPETTFRNPGNPIIIFTSQALAILGMAMFALAFVLAARAKWMEPFFGGLDKMYDTHHKIAKTAFFLLLAHPILLLARFIPYRIDKAILFLFPFHARSAVNFGSYAWWGFLILMILTLVIKIAYDKWKISHKFLGIFFILGAFHIFLIDGNITNTVLLSVYFVFLVGAGITAYIYRIFLYHKVIKKYPYKVEQVYRQESILEIILHPFKEKISFTPGQFFFFSFRDPRISKEAHPYTICNTPAEDFIQIFVKSLGDFTHHLYERLEPGMKVLLDGPYGGFNFIKGQHEQVWIAGGVGIAPFISWAKYLKQLPQKSFNINLYYCVNKKSEAIHFDELKQVEENDERFNVDLICAEEVGFMSAEDIPNIHEKEIFICGPAPMRYKLNRQLINRRVKKNNIHFEDFDFY